MASWMKEHAAKAKNIQVTAEDQRKATEAEPARARTAPGHLMQLQATAERQRQEIAELKAQKGSRAKRPISRMHEVEGRRRKLTPEQYAELKANLAQYPLAYPVVLEERADGDWNINAGNNRVAIYRDLGIEEIDSIVTDVDPALAEKMSFWSNLFAPSLSDYEKYVNFQRLLDGADVLSQQELAEASGLHPSHVSRIFQFHGLPEEAKAILAERPDRLGAEAATHLARAATEGREKEVVAAIRELVANDKYLQKDAVQAVQAKKALTKTSAPEPLVVKNGKKNFCEITARAGVIGVKFKGDAESTEKWAAEIREFIERKLSERRD